MLVTVRYTQEVETPFDETFFVVIAKETLIRCPLSALKEKQAVSVNVIAVSSEKIQELNRAYLGKDAVTDILSFGEYADTMAFEKDAESVVFLGEIFFCPAFIGTSATEDGVTLEHEMTYVFSHGVLHLLGYDHSDEMFSLQDQTTEFLMQHHTTEEK